MRQRPLTLAALVATAIATVGVSRAHAASVEHLTLRELVERAHRIVRGTVLTAEEGSLSAGGGVLPITVYRIRIAEVVKGPAPAEQVLEVRLLSPRKGGVAARGQADAFRDLPEFLVGQEYLFALTRPGRIGLSTTVGLGQGLFALRGAIDRRQAVNQWNNVGLFIDSPVTSAAPAPSAGRAIAPVTRAAGPVAYSALIDEIRRLTR